MNRAFALALFSLSSIGLTLFACSASESGSPIPVTAPQGDGGAGSSSGSSGAPFADAASDGTTSSSGEPACKPKVISLETRELELLIGFDVSSSMQVSTASGQSKFQVVKNAMKRFVDDPTSAGVNLGMQAFPLPSGACTSDMDCGVLGAGRCFSKVCAGTVGQLVSCTDNSTCSVSLPGSTCQAYDRCERSSICRPLEYGDLNGPLAFASAPLPGASEAFKTKLDSYKAEGDVTPTSVVLQGLVNAANSSKMKNVNRDVAIVLATDGLPTGCTGFSTKPEVIAAEALKKEVPTFALGIFAPEDIAAGQGALNAIAQSGGTNKAYVAGTSTTASEDLFSALKEIRSSSSASCSYTLPNEAKAELTGVNVALTADPSRPLPYRGSEADCRGATGWFFDVDPNLGNVPSKINLCKQSCDAARATPLAKIDVSIACKRN
jgi:hypothetical protein